CCGGQTAHGAENAARLDMMLFAQTLDCVAQVFARRESAGNGTQGKRFSGLHGDWVLAHCVEILRRRAREHDVVGTQADHAIALRHISPRMLRRMRVNATRDVALLAGLDNLADRFLHLRVIDLAGQVHAAGHVEWADEYAIDTGHIENRVDVLHRLDVLDLHDHRDLLVRALHVGVEVQVKTLGTRDADRAESAGWIFTPANCELRVLRVVYERNDDSGRADVQRFFDVCLVVPRHPHHTGNSKKRWTSARPESSFRS